MDYPKITIKLSDYKGAIPEEIKTYLKKNNITEGNPFEIVLKVKGKITVCDAMDLIASIPAFQTEEKWKYFKSLKPNLDEIYFLIRDVPVFQTEDKWKNLMSLNPNLDEIYFLIRNVPA